jgi:acyl carrier protein
MMALSMDANLAPKVIEIIAKTQHLDPTRITLDSSYEELGIDSLDGVNILFALENEFDIQIPDEAAKEIRGVRQTVDGVAKLLAAKA